MNNTILCADDSATMQTVAEITFRATEFTYVGARSAEDAMNKARANKPRLVLADVVMPGKDGYELCEAIKSDPALADVPVIVMCGKSQAYDSDKGAAAGVDGHVTKPWDTQVMLETIAELLARVENEGVARVGGGRTAPVAGRPAASAARAPSSPAPAPVSRSSPQTPALSDSGAARTATLMGMPTLKMPPRRKGSIPPAPPVSPPARPTTAGRPASSPAGQTGRATTPRAVTPHPSFAGQTPAGMSRPPMLKGLAKRRTSAPIERVQTARPEPVAAQPPRAAAQTPRASSITGVTDRVAAVAAEVAREAGLDPNGQEVGALVKLSREVVERVVWEVVPELAEAIIRENLDRLVAKAR